MFQMRMAILVGALLQCFSAGADQDYHQPHQGELLANCSIPQKLIPPALQEEYNADYMNFTIREDLNKDHFAVVYIEWGDSEYPAYVPSVTLPEAALVLLNKNDEGKPEKILVSFFREFDLETVDPFLLFISTSDSQIHWYPRDHLIRQRHYLEGTIDCEVPEGFLHVEPKQ